MIVDAAGARIVEANGARPDALLSGSAAAWRRAADGGGAFAALGRGGLRLRHNLHVGAGFLAATSGATAPGACGCARSRRRIGRDRHRPGGQRPAAAGAARPRRHEGVVPADARRAGRRATA